MKYEPLVQIILKAIRFPRISEFEMAADAASCGELRETIMPAIETCPLPDVLKTAAAVNL